MNFFSFIKRLVRYILRGRRKHFIVSDSKRVVYILNPKVCSTSIRHAFRDEIKEDARDLPLENQVKKKLKKHTLTTEQKAYPAFSFVRNPFDRLVSCYLHRVKGKEGSSTPLIRGWHGFGATITDNETFESFAHKVANIPDMFANVHFRSQHTFLYKNNKPLFSDLGKFESFDTDVKEFVQRFDLSSVPHANISNRGDWREYYTTPIAKVVYKRYKKDIKLFGYEEAYQDLLSYLEEKGV